jgi:hypothetical protein
MIRQEQVTALLKQLLMGNTGKKDDFNSRGEICNYLPFFPTHR